MSQVQDSNERTISPNVLAGLGSAPIESSYSFDVLPSFPKIFSFSGRMARSTFWLIQLIYLLVAVAAVFTFDGFFTSGFQEILTVGTPLVRSYSNGAVVSALDRIGGGDELRWGMVVLCFAAWYLVGLATTVRRLHDVGYPGSAVIWLGIGGAIPYLGAIVGLIQLVILCTRSVEGPNEYGDPPAPAFLLARLRRLPRHIWRGETSLPNMVFAYAFFVNFILFDKVGSVIVHTIGLSTINLLYLAALLLLNCILVVSIWRCATISIASARWRIFGRLLALVLALRVAITFASLATA